MLSMTESDERLEAVSDKIDEAQQAAKPLAEQDVIDPDSVEDDVAPSGDEVSGPDDAREISGPDVPDTDPDESPADSRS
jgi:hypothetical protein